MASEMNLLYATFAALGVRSAEFFVEIPAAVIFLAGMGVIGSAVGFWLSRRRLQHRRHLDILNRYADRQNGPSASTLIPKQPAENQQLAIK
jgi:hypothetical protein